LAKGEKSGAFGLTEHNVINSYLEVGMLDMPYERS
jgi:hypothetical protein